GMSAIFDLQGGFSVDDGLTGQSGAGASWQGTPGVAGSARIFGRQAYAGLKGGFGQITAGRQYAPYDNAFGSVDAQGYTANSAMGSVWAGGIHADGNGPGRIDNQLTYFTPAMGGFNAQLSWAPGENGVAGGANAGRYYGLGLGFANGPINVQFASESLKALAGGGTTNAWLLGGSYNLGVVRPYIAYGRAKNAVDTVDKSWSVGIAAPVGPVTLQVGWARETSDVNGPARSTKVSGFGAQAVYSLSKRTNAYVEWMNVTIDNNTAIDGKNRRLGVGMRHDF
ncbi:MAG: porin, partial [Burkholderiaceae bacterium]